ncbi:hypothetical protein [Dyella japonica]|uniref:Phage ABA sandwich domain-containing protein n=1 Tax=Dyella japonica TaxID=231455 RepID=A0ABV2JYX7_9GAMM
MNDETMREAFEKWADLEGMSIEVWSNGLYYEPSTHEAWVIWQSAWNRAQASAPEGEAVAWITPQHLAQLRTDDKKNPIGVVGALVYSRNILHTNCQEIRIPLFTRSNAKAGEVEFAYAMGWRRAAIWADRDDLICDIDSPAYEKEMQAALSTHDKTKA